VSKNRALVLLVIILLAAFFLREHKLLSFPFFGDELEDGNIALEILHGHIAPFYPHAAGQEALYIYTMAVSFAVLGDSVIANRWPSVMWSLLLAPLMYVYGRLLFKSRRVGVMAAAITAGLWWPAVFAHVGLRAISLPVMMVPALAGLVIALCSSSERRALWAGVVGGVFAGLAAYTYTSGRGFPAIVVLFVAYAALTQRTGLIKRWRVFVVYVVLMAAVSAWLYVYLHLHPDYDVRIGFAGQGLDMLTHGDYTALLKALTDTLGMFTVRGESVWLYNITGRPVFAGPEGWLFYLGVLLCVWRLRKPEYALQLIVIATMLIPSLVTEHPPSWTRSVGILPGLLVTTVLPVEWAWARLESGLKRKWATPSMEPLLRRVGLPLYAALVIVLGVSVYGRTAYDLLNVWMNHPGVYWMTFAFYSETADYINRSADTTPLSFNMDVTIPWRITNLSRAVQRRDVQLRWTANNALAFPDHPGGLRVAFQSSAPPAPVLQQIFFDPGPPLYIGPRADPTGEHPLRIYHVSPGTLEEHLVRAQANPVFLPHTHTPVASKVQVGGLLEFLGYEILNPDAQPGSELRIMTFWRVLQRPPDLSVFVHLISESEDMVTQSDGFDVVSDYLEPGDVVAQLHALPLPVNLDRSVYRLQAGAYRLDNLERLPLNVDVPDRLVWLQSWQLR
jgi:hypothetical protein